MKPAGVVLRAADALTGGQQTFTSDQVAVLLSLAYDAGRTARYADDLAELHATWARHRAGRTHDELVAERLREMEAASERIYRALGKPAGYRYTGGPVPWDDSTPAEPVRQLAVVG